jgi:secernin
MNPTSCDTMVALGSVTANGQTLFAKNSDRPPDECQPLIQHARRCHAADAYTRCQFVDVPEVAVTYRHIGSRPHWCWGYEHGFNEHQVVIGNEALPSRLPEAEEAKLVGMELIRLGLERSRSAAEALEVITGLVSRFGQGKFANGAGIRTYDNGYIVADPHEAFIIETAGHQWAVKEVEKTVGISNVYSLGSDWHSLSPGAEAGAAGPGWTVQSGGRFDFAATYGDPASWTGSGASRRARSCALLNLRMAEIDTATMMRILSDHGNGQSPADSFQTDLEVPWPAICMHPDQENSWGNTAASLIADLCADGSRLPVYWCSFYSPCLGLFLPIFIEGDLPEVLAVGGPTPDRQSPWWLFHRLAHLARAESGSRVPQVRERWAPLQANLLESGYAMAREGRQLIDEGRSDEARVRLSGYMAGNSATMLSIVRQMIGEFEAQSTPQNENPEGALA